MKKFRVIKSSIDGVCGGHSRMPIADACQEIMVHKGWDSIQHLRDRINEWSKTAKTGDVFCTHASVIVCASSR